MTLVTSTPVIRVHDSPSDFLLLEEGWKALFEQHGHWNVFLSWQWFRQWWSCFGARNKLRLLTASKDGRLVGIVPAMIEVGESGERTLALIGSDRTTDYAGVLAAPDELEALLEVFADFVLERSDRFDRVELRSLPPESPLLGAFLDRVRSGGVATHVDVSNTCPRARLAPTWEEYLATLGKKDRHELRRKIRRSQTTGDQQILMLSSPDGVAAGLDSFFRLHRASAPEKDAFLDEGMVTFFRGMALAFAREGWLRLNIMKIDGRDVAASLSFARGDRVLLYNSGLDPEYRNHSVGIALHAAEMQETIERGLLWYDFLRGNEPYKYGLGAQDTPLYTLTIMPGEPDTSVGGASRG